jgi:hypothetical protein
MTLDTPNPFNFKPSRILHYSSEQRNSIQKYIRNTIEPVRNLLGRLEYCTKQIFKATKTAGAEEVQRQGSRPHSLSIPVLSQCTTCKILILSMLGTKSEIYHGPSSRRLLNVLFATGRTRDLRKSYAWQRPGLECRGFPSPLRRYQVVQRV